MVRRYVVPAFRRQVIEKPNRSCRRHSAPTPWRRTPWNRIDITSRNSTPQLVGQKILVPIRSKGRGSVFFDGQKGMKKG
jgi:hypothetical protein